MLLAKFILYFRAAKKIILRPSITYKIYFQLLHLKNQLSGIIHEYIFYFAINFNKENCLLINWHTPSKYLQILATCTEFLNI